MTPSPALRALSATLALLLATTTGCATILKGSSEAVTIYSNPPGAQTWIDGMFVGQTPLAVSLEVKRAHQLVLRLAGYQDQGTVITNQIGAGWVVLDVLMGLVPIVVDLVTGAWYSLHDVYVTMVPASGVAVVAPAGYAAPPAEPAAPASPCPEGYVNDSAPGAVPVCRHAGQLPGANP